MAAYVGCIAGAIQIDDYREGLLAAGFEHVEIVDSGADLNAYAKVENQAGCCSPSMDTANGLTVLGDACCSTDTPTATSLHEDLTKLLSEYDVNAAAASVKVYAVKPRRAQRSAVAVQPAAHREVAERYLKMPPLDPRLRIEHIGRRSPTQQRSLSGMRTFIFACVHNAGRSQMSAAFFNS